MKNNSLKLLMLPLLIFISLFIIINYQYIYESKCLIDL